MCLLIISNVIVIMYKTNVSIILLIIICGITPLKIKPIKLLNIIQFSPIVNIVLIAVKI